jgi:predicted ester cyclase
MSPEENKAQTRRAFDEFINKKNLAVAGEYIAPNYVGHFTNAPLVQGVAGFQQYLSMWNGAIPDSLVTIDDAVAEGDKVVVRVTYRGTHTGPLQNIPPTGKSITVSGINIFRMVNGLAVEQWALIDDLGMMQQLGLIPAQQA